MSAMVEFGGRRCPDSTNDLLRDTDKRSAPRRRDLGGHVAGDRRLTLSAIRLASHQSLSHRPNNIGVLSPHVSIAVDLLLPYRHLSSATRRLPTLLVFLTGHCHHKLGLILPEMFSGKFWRLMEQVVYTPRALLFTNSVTVTALSCLT